jgi:RND superfamily putative drug exporter
MPERWTRAVLRRRTLVLSVWAAVAVAGAFAAAQLSSVLVTSFAVPGSESDRAAMLLARHFGERPEGTFVVVFPVRRPSDPALRRRLQGRLDTAARAVPGARAGELREGGGILYGEVATGLDLQEAKGFTDELRRALHEGAGPRGLVTGQPAIQRDLDPILASDLRRGEAFAVPVALLVLLMVFGVSRAVVIPFVFAACTILATLAAVYVGAHVLTTTPYVTNLVALIGLGLAIDYSLLIVHRFREELVRGVARDDAVARTMATAGRTVVLSGFAVAIGLGLLLFVPVPFIRSLGLGGLLVPVITIVGALTLQPVLLPVLGAPGGTRQRAADGRLRWERFAWLVVRRRAAVLAGATGLLLALAMSALGLHLVPGSFSGILSTPESGRALGLLRHGVGDGAITPTDVVIDTGAPGGARSQAVRRAIVRLAGELQRDPEAYVVASGRRPPYVDGSGRYARVVVVGRHEYGARQTQSFVRRLRDTLVPGARFPAGVHVESGGAPPQGVDFLATAYGAFPWLALAVCLATYFVLLRAFRSLLLPMTAVLVNLLTVAAVFGLLTLSFGEVEGWVPIFLFATLFGLSMDYEVFLVMRTRESWEATRDTDGAVVQGLARTGRVVTAAALIMVATFLGFTAGRVTGLRQLGLGLALAVLLDATVVRMLLVPSLIAVLGRRSWWLPGWLARLVGVRPSPLPAKP